MFYVCVFSKQLVCSVLAPGSLELPREGEMSLYQNYVSISLHFSIALMGLDYFGL